MSEPSAVPPPIKLTLTHWLILTLAAIGFAFDIYELLMLPLIVRPAMLELLPAGASPDTWRSVLFYVPALAGGVFGLLGGYLTDLLGRRRVLTGSIIVYALSAFLAGFSTNIWMLLFLRCTTFIGFCVEFVAAVAWLAELFPNPHQREKVLGYTQGFSSFGGLLVAIVNNILLSPGTPLSAENLPAIAVPDFLGVIKDAHAAWRYTLMSGLLPAIPLLIIRPFLPESDAWLKKKQAGTLKRPSIGQLFSPQLRKTTIVTTLMVACNYGAALGAIQLIPQIVPGLANVEQEVSEKQAAAKEKAVKEGKSPDEIKAAVFKAKGDVEQRTGAEYTKIQEVGGLIGRFLIAVLGLVIISRRGLLRLFQIPGLIFLPLLFFYFLKIDNITFFELDLSAIYLKKFPITTVSLGVLVAGLFTVAQFSFWGNYLPRVYPLHLRGTGEGFAANIGGRAIGTGFNWVTTLLAAAFASSEKVGPGDLALAAACTAGFVYVVGSLLCFWLPEPTEELQD